MSVKWYCVARVVKYDDAYDSDIRFYSQDFMKVYKEYMKNHLFTMYWILETGIHPEGVPAQTLFNRPVMGYLLRNERVVYCNTISLDEKTTELIARVTKETSAYMQRFVKHVYSTYIGKTCICTCYINDEYLSEDGYRHFYDLDSNTFTTLKQVHDKMVPYIVT